MLIFMMWGATRFQYIIFVCFFLYMGIRNEHKRGQACATCVRKVGRETTRMGPQYMVGDPPRRSRIYNIPRQVYQGIQYILIEDETCLLICNNNFTLHDRDYYVSYYKLKLLSPCWSDISTLQGTYLKVFRAGNKCMQNHFYGKSNIDVESETPLASI